MTRCGELGVGGRFLRFGQVNQVFVMVLELLKKAEERKDGRERDCLRFWRDGHERNDGQLFLLHGSTSPRV